VDVNGVADLYPSDDEYDNAEDDDSEIDEDAIDEAVEILNEE